MDRPPEDEDGWCPGLLTTSSASSSSLFSPSSPPRVRRGIKTQLLHGMQGGGGGGKAQRGKKQYKVQPEVTSSTLLLFSLL